MQSLWMIAASFCFACMGVCVKLAAESFSAAEIVFYRSAISLLLMVGLLRLRGIAIATPHWRFQLLRAGSGFISLLLYFYAITNDGVSTYRHIGANLRAGINESCCVNH